MSEIKIEKKKLVWPWVLLGLALFAVLIYFLLFYEYNGETNEVLKRAELIESNENLEIETKETNLISINENNSTVETYVKFIEKDDNKMGLNHEFTNEALLKLIDATNAMANEVRYEVRADLEKAAKYAEMITIEPFETTHADNIRDAVDILTKVLQNIQKANYPGLTREVTDLKNAAESIKPGVLTLNQRNEVKNFFRKAADLLKKMN